MRAVDQKLIIDFVWPYTYNIYAIVQKQVYLARGKMNIKVEVLLILLAQCAVVKSTHT